MRRAASIALISSTAACASWFVPSPAQGWCGPWRLVVVSDKGHPAEIAEDGSRREVLDAVVKAMRVKGYDVLSNWVVSPSGEYVVVTGGPAAVPMGERYAIPDDPTPLTVAFDTRGTARELFRLETGMPVGWDAAHDLLAVARSVYQTGLPPTERQTLYDVTRVVVAHLAAPGLNTLSPSLSCVAFSPDGSEIAYRGTGGSLLIASRSTGATVEVGGCFAQGRVLSVLAWLADGRIACGMSDGSAVLGSPRGELDHEFLPAAAMLAISCRPDGEAVTFEWPDFGLSLAPTYGRLLVFRDGHSTWLWRYVDDHEVEWWLSAR